MRQKGAFLSSNRKTNADSMAIEGRKWLESIHISEDIWFINENT